MSIADTDRRSRRRAALRVAMRTGDTIAVSRAWDRLRGAGDVVSMDQAVAARMARASLGRAIRAARWRKVNPQP
ncbi:MAG: hypothetical protein ACRDGT_07755, partial [Candidatus Limnocylindria bacterium]